MPDAGCRRRLWVAALVASLACAGCATADPANDPGTGVGQQQAAGTSTAAGTSAAAGTNPGRATTAETPTTTPAPPPQLPGGGRQVFPTYRLVGFSGAPGSPALGRLTGDLDAAAATLAAQAAPYAAGRRILPVFELIATVADAVPGADGDYSRRAPDEEIAEYLAAARRAGALLLLNIQPGRADFLPEVQAYERWLREPDVGIALDPEWAVGPTGVPGEVYGQTTGQELDGVSAYLSGLVAAGNLPDKVMVYHQVAPQVVLDETALTNHPGVAVVKSVDGIGGQADKEETWYRLMPTKPTFVAAGFKLFYDEDLRGGPLMTPEQVLALQPMPDYILYE